MMWCSKVRALTALTCVFIGSLLTCEVTATETLTPEDAHFCHGGLEVIYPETDISDCVIIPTAQREKLSKEWGAPQVKLATAKKRKYTLMMVDPDAPSRSNPSRSHWRHWLIADIEGQELKRGNVKGTVLSEYTRPTPPQKSGLHRYQFMIFEQPDGQTLSLSKEENASRGNWEPQAFIGRFRLGHPVACLQFLTRSYKE
ncbi:phosphatidylethanolamine-binding protein 4 [Engraulis encrasicolus]|uniref:phosphatidylethanolamine-binding protein 4 n=1 Tax=Engraulis encrasicolus TaxID=184585 RepID=UPI002FCF14B4